jgi:hypothetical protein
MALFYAGVCSETAEEAVCFFERARSAGALAAVENESCHRGDVAFHLAHAYLVRCISLALSPIRLDKRAP